MAPEHDRAAAAGFELVVHVLDAPREVRRARVEARNRERGETFSMIVPPAIFELASDMWEAPIEEERARDDIEMVFVDVTRPSSDHRRAPVGTAPLADKRRPRRRR